MDERSDEFTRHSAFHRLNATRRSAISVALIANVVVCCSFYIMDLVLEWNPFTSPIVRSYIVPACFASTLLMSAPAMFGTIYAHASIWITVSSLPSWACNLACFILTISINETCRKVKENERTGQYTYDSSASILKEQQQLLFCKNNNVSVVFVIVVSAIYLASIFIYAYFVVETFKVISSPEKVVAESRAEEDKEN